MFIKSQFAAQIRTAFASYSRHFDYGLVRLQLERLLCNYGSLSAEEARDMRKQVADDFHDAFRNSDPWLPLPVATPVGALPPPPKPALSLDEKAELYLKAMFDVAPVLFEEARITLLTSVDRMDRLTHDKPGKPGEIPCFQALQKFPAFEDPLRNLVSICMKKHPAWLAAYCRELKDTPHFNLVDESCAEGYLTSLHAGDTLNLAYDLATLAQMPDVWKNIDGQAGPLYVFGAYAPPIKGGHLADEIESAPENYQISYSAQSNFLALNFNSAIYFHEEEATWAYDILDEEPLKSLYILLKHAEGVLEGTRMGQVATNQEWIDYQKKYLLPCLKTDLAALTEQLKNLGLKPPFVPQPIIPAAATPAPSPIFYSGAPVLRRP